MPLLTPRHPDLRRLLANPATTVVICLCADWCGTCRDYRPAFEELAAQLPDDHLLIWLDVEDDADWLDAAEDIEQFPTLWIERDGVVRFYGPMLPHIRQLDDLLARLRDQRYDGRCVAPNLRAALLASA